MAMAARKYAEDIDLEACLHDQQRHSPSSPSGLYRLESGTVTRSGVVPINRSSAPSPPSIPRAASMPDIVVGERMSAFELHAPPRQLMTTGLIAGIMMFLAMTVLAAIAYYR